jgi:hypothetical protein
LIVVVEDNAQNLLDIAAHYSGTDTTLLLVLYDPKVSDPNDTVAYKRLKHLITD